LDRRKKKKEERKEGREGGLSLNTTFSLTNSARPRAKRKREKEKGEEKDYTTFLSKREKPNDDVLNGEGGKRKKGRESSWRRPLPGVDSPQKPKKKKKAPPPPQEKEKKCDPTPPPPPPPKEQKTHKPGIPYSTFIKREMERERGEGKEEGT